MNFFEHQERARRHTGRLVLLFAVAVLAIVAAVDLVVIGAILASRDHVEDMPSQAGIVALATVITLCVIVGGSLFQLSQLRAGGRVVAERLNGRLLNANTTDPHERRLLNVVEEMAIASGVPTPPVYVMDHERSINAFAAGYTPHDAVIGVTRGTLELLNRDELQGVMAHEFSHILNGDMRLNIRLIGVLFGIMLITIIGHTLLRVAFYSGHGRRSRNDREGGGAIPLFAIGLALLVIGSIGSFFGSLIRASVSRQREYLADASAVQFTRNPSGIADALKRIGGLSQRAYIRNSSAAEMAHLFFGEAVHLGLSSMMATHPPLRKRIKRIEPSWDGVFLATESLPVPVDAAEERRIRAKRMAALSAAVTLPGAMTEDHLHHAAEMFHSIPLALRDAAHEPFSARAVVLALLLSPNGTVRGKQMTALHRAGDVNLARAVERLTAPALALDQRLRLPLLDIAIPTLRALSPRQLQVFDREVAALVEADGRLGLFEWTLQRLLRHSLAEGEHVTRKRITHYGIQHLHQPCAALLSCVAYAGHTSTDAAQRAFEAAWGRLQMPPQEMLPTTECGLHDLDSALDALESVAPKAKKLLIEAVAVCVAQDREVTPDEGELLRAISEALGVPMPPVLPGQALV